MRFGARDNATNDADVFHLMEARLWHRELSAAEVKANNYILKDSILRFDSVEEFSALDGLVPEELIFVPTAIEHVGFPTIFLDHTAEQINFVPGVHEARTQAQMAMIGRAYGSKPKILEGVAALPHIALQAGPTPPVPNDWPSFNTEWAFDTESEGIDYTVLSDTGYEWRADVSGKWQCEAESAFSDKPTLTAAFTIRYKFTYKDTGGSPAGMNTHALHFMQGGSLLGGYKSEILGPEFHATAKCTIKLSAEPNSDTSGDIAVDETDFAFFLEWKADGAGGYTLKAWTDDFDGSSLVADLSCTATTARTWNGLAFDDATGGGGPGGASGTDDFKEDQCSLAFS
jgi:hypothetical protein